MLALVLLPLTTTTIGYRAPSFSSCCGYHAPILPMTDFSTENSVYATFWPPRRAYFFSRGAGLAKLS